MWPSLHADPAPGGTRRGIRGQKGGYQLARPAEAISVAEVLTALGGHLLEGLLQ
jgi:hypothetical protein